MKKVIVLLTILSFSQTAFSETEQKDTSVLDATMNAIDATTDAGTAVLNSAPGQAVMGKASEAAMYAYSQYEEAKDTEAGIFASKFLLSIYYQSLLYSVSAARTFDNQHQETTVPYYFKEGDDSVMKRFTKDAAPMIITLPPQFFVLYKIVKRVGMTPLNLLASIPAGFKTASKARSTKMIEADAQFTRKLNIIIKEATENKNQIGFYNGKKVKRLTSDLLRDSKKSTLGYMLNGAKGTAGHFIKEAFLPLAIVGTTVSLVYLEYQGIKGIMMSKSDYELFKEDLIKKIEDLKIEMAAE